MESDLFITFEHLATVPGLRDKPGFCHKESRTFCARYGISWSEIVANGGVYASVLLATKDALAEQVVAHAKKCEAANG